MISENSSSLEKIQHLEDCTDDSRKVKVTKQLVRNLFAIGIFNFGYNFVTTAEYVYFRRIMTDVGFSSATLISILFAAALGALCIGAMLGGFINDKIESRFGQRVPSIFVGSLGAALLFCIIPIVTQFANNITTVFILLLAFLVIAHVLLGSAYSPWMSLVTDLFQKKERTLAGVVINVLSAAGAAIAIIAFSKLIECNLSWVIWIVTGGSLAIGAILTSILVQYKNQENREEVKLSDIIRIPKIFWRYGGLPWVLLLIVNLFWGFGSHLVETGLVDSLVTRFGVLETTASMASNILMGVVIAVLIIPVIWFVNKIGKIKASIIASISYAVFCILLACMQNFSAIYFIVIIGGLSNILISTLQIALPADWVPKGREASFMGIFFVCSTIIKPIATLIQGILLENKEHVSTLSIFGGYPWTFIFASISCVIAMIILFVMLTKKQEQLMKDLA